MTVDAGQGLSTVTATCAVLAHGLRAIAIGSRIVTDGITPTCHICLAEWNVAQIWAIGGLPKPGQVQLQQHDAGPVHATSSPGAGQGTDQGCHGRNKSAGAAIVGQYQLFRWRRDGLLV